ncbi:UNVERIFIED_CONTAM: hypothetical protein HDU68_010513 [Siphonaria sp. JEL0065]|nr:hypothetical protein HDU68_010513 [Siphonaria sp. JEL0065]
MKNDVFTVKEQITSASITVRGAKDPVKVTVSESTTDSPVSTISHTISAATEAAAKRPIFNFVFMAGRLNIDVSLNKTDGSGGGGGFLSWFTQETVEITLNIVFAKGTVMTDFTHDIEVGELVYLGPSNVDNFCAINGIGAIKIDPKNGLFCQFATIKVNMGDIKIPNSISVTKNVDIKVDVGSCKAFFSDYETLNGVARLGDLILTLRPSYPVSFTELACSTGSVKVDFAGFDGRFDFKAKLGSVAVKAPRGIKNSSNPCNGIVGDDDAQGNLSINVSMGDIKVDFSE